HPLHAGESAFATFRNFAEVKVTIVCKIRIANRGLLREVAEAKRDIGISRVFPNLIIALSICPNLRTEETSKEVKGSKRVIDLHFHHLVIEHDVRVGAGNKFRYGWITPVTGF